jgi:S1-C subfamily serine protease
VIPDSPADRAGIRADDLLVTINAQVATSRRDAVELVERLERDSEVQVSVLRDKEFLEFRLTAEGEESPTSDDEVQPAETSGDDELKSPQETTE